MSQSAVCMLRQPSTALYASARRCECTNAATDRSARVGYCWYSPIRCAYSPGPRAEAEAPRHARGMASSGRTRMRAHAVALARRKQQRWSRGSHMLGAQQRRQKRTVEALEGALLVLSFSTSFARSDVRNAACACSACGRAVERPLWD